MEALAGGIPSQEAHYYLAPLLWTLPLRSVAPWPCCGRPGDSLLSQPRPPPRLIVCRQPRVLVSSTPGACDRCRPMGRHQPLPTPLPVQHRNNRAASCRRAAEIHRSPSRSYLGLMVAGFAVPTVGYSRTHWRPRLLAGCVFEAPSDVRRQTGPTLGIIPPLCAVR
jgi:hypothetical protein